MFFRVEYVEYINFPTNLLCPFSLRVMGIKNYCSFVSNNLAFIVSKMNTQTDRHGYIDSNMARSTPHGADQQNHNQDRLD